MVGRSCEESFFDLHEVDGAFVVVFDDIPRSIVEDEFGVLLATLHQF